MKKVKKIISQENLLSFFIIMCPILDIASFLFRKSFDTNYSISTFIRPIIPILIFVYIFFKQKNQNKLKTIGICIVYTIYGLVHLYIYNNLKVKCSFGTVLHEAQYIVNYSFMILNLFIFGKVFNNDNGHKLRKAILISTAIYIISIYLSIITKTTSTTYIEGIGYKGWFESGNSISAILILSTMIILSFIMKLDNKIIKSFEFTILILVGIYLMTLIGTRVGLIGFVLAILCFITAQIFEKVVVKSKIKKRNFIVLLSILVLLITVVCVAGSVTMKRRKHLRNMENTIIDQSTGEVSNLTGDLTTYRNQIINNNMEDGVMTEAQKQSIVDLYNVARKYNISNTDTRMQQLIYHCMLMKNQKNILLIIFGNGYLINTNELVWEMELPAFLLNFGIIGFLLYIVPFIVLVIKVLKMLVKKFKKIDTEFIMLFLAVLLSFALSTLSGYTFFNSSSMIIIITANILLKNKVKELEEGDN